MFRVLLLVCAVLSAHTTIAIRDETLDFASALEKLMDDNADAVLEEVEEKRNETLDIIYQHTDTLRTVEEEIDALSKGDLMKCDGELVEGLCFILGNQQYNRRTAEMSCQGNSSLAVIDTQKEYKAITKYIRGHALMANTPLIMAWTDMNINGTEASIHIRSNWSPGYPRHDHDDIMLRVMSSTFSMFTDDTGYINAPQLAIGYPLCVHTPINHLAPAEWTKWEPKGKCSAECGEGTQTFTRKCVGVGSCEGEMKKNETCNVKECECDSSPCQNGATCSDGVNSYTCECVLGYSGDNCETDVNECDANPCQNGAVCNDGVNSYTCDCADGYSGDNCETDVDECNPNPCQNGATCNDGVNSYTCQCQDGFIGDNCETVDEPCYEYVGGYNGYCTSTGTSIGEIYTKASHLGLQDEPTTAAGYEAAKANCDAIPKCLGFRRHYYYDRYVIATDIMKTLECSNFAGNICGDGTPTNGCYVKSVCGSGTPFTYEE